MIINVVVLVGVFALIFYKLGIKFSKKTKVINRADIFEKRLESVLKINKSKTFVLEQRGNVIGLARNLNFYQNVKNKLFFILYSPKLIEKIPNPFDYRVLIISEKYITPFYKDDGEIAELERLNEMRFRYEGKIDKHHEEYFDYRRKHQELSKLKIDDDFFIDRWFNINISYDDEDAINFVKMRLNGDSAEMTSSIQMAQSLRLSTVDFSKAYEPTSANIIQERVESDKK